MILLRTELIADIFFIVCFLLTSYVNYCTSYVNYCTNHAKYCLQLTQENLISRKIEFTSYINFCLKLSQKNAFFHKN